MKTAERSVQVDALSPSGEGLGRVDGKSVKVAGALPGERVRAVVHKDSARLVTIESPSPDRVEPRCSLHGECGGCAWQHASPSLQRSLRVERIRRALPPALRELEIGYVPAPQSYRYRTRARLGWAVRKGVVLLGHRARSSEEVVDAKECPVLDERLESALEPLREVLAAVGAEGEVSLALGVGGNPVASIHPTRDVPATGFGVCAKLVEYGLAGAALWPPGATSPTVEGDPRAVVRGADDEPLILGVDGFAQANEALNIELAATVRRSAEAEGSVVLELYAGALYFTVLLARDAAKVTAVESDRRAVEALEENLRRRAIENVTIRRGRAEDSVDARRLRADVVVLDPPREGAREVCKMLAQWATVDRVVYVSCNPMSLGADLAELTNAHTDQGYEVASLTAFGMFPQTPHVEVVAALRLATGRRRAGGRGTAPPPR